MEIGPIQKTIVVADYKIIECMLSSTKELTKSEGYAFAIPWLGTGLLTGDGKLGLIIVHSDNCNSN